MNRKRVQAFTIIEVTIAMLLAAIVIGITYTAYSIISRSYISFYNKNENMAVLVRLDELLKKDVALSDTVIRTNNGVLFEGAKDTITYEIDSDHTVRHSTIIDTFKLETQQISTSFEGQPVVERQAGEQARIDDLGFTVLFESEKIPYHYHKDHSSASLINRNPNASN